MAMDPKADKLIRRTAMVASITAAYFLLTADYGPQENALGPIKRGIESVESSVKNFIFGRGKETEGNHQTSSQPKKPEQDDKAKAK
ncbi:uncharacterized protein A4U43_C01F8850 [Asparagus officinalis]|uniref:Uncharacterized protein n=1 Tax=Asparagus officinalis TaxID=4686 RepID=A0A5P1FSI7_ASPOF|nr:uncharacterized protein LOC109819717 [Asparagus officinalis]ONK79671.1 uncharacterized protein A4U43_C01F8850 [Asparagus officinalis]